MRIAIAESKRLIIRKFTKKDAPFLLTLLNSPEWLKMLASQHIKNIKDAEYFLKNHILKDYENHPYGFFIMETKDGNQPIGLCGMSLRPHQEIPDLGFGILPRFSGLGYTLEAASTVIHYIHTHLELEYIDAFTAISNTPSQKLLSKLQFLFIEEVYHTEFHSWVKHYRLNLRSKHHLP